MASYTDQIMQSRPYVQQLPLEAMAQVGMYKQQRYEEGVQKIQGQIDKIAGMDVIRGIDKQYLQSKLNELGGRLKTVAAGDFSNFQLVNSVGGMANQIVQDKNVQNAVTSTSRYRKGLLDMEAARKEGKSSPSNEFVFKRDAGRWLNSTDLEESFSGSFDQYTNWKKTRLETLKALTKDETITDDALTTDPKGNIVLGDAIIRRKYAGLTPEKIQQALMASLTPADFKQMQIDGIYTYANKSDEDFKASIQTSYRDNLEAYTGKRKEFENLMLGTTSAEVKDKMKDQIQSLDKTIDSLKKEYDGVLEMINSGNVDGAKANLYTKDALHNFSKAFSFTELSKTYENSPPADMAMRRAIKDQDWLKFTTQLSWDKQKWGEEKTEKQKDRDLKTKELGLMYGGLPMPIDQSLLPKISIDKMTEDVDKQISAVTTSDATFMQQNGGKDQAWFDTQYTQWKQRPNSVDPTVAAYFKTTEVARRTVETNQQMLIDSRKVAENNARAKYGFGTIEELIPKNAPTLVYNSASTGKMVISPKDIVGFNSKKNRYIYTKPTADEGAAYPTFEDDLAKRELSSNEYLLYTIFKKQAKGQPLNNGESTILQNAVHYNKTVNHQYNLALSDIKNDTDNELKNRITNYQGVSYGLPTMNAAQRSALGTAIVNFADFADRQKGGIANSPKFDSGTLREIATDPEAKFNIVVAEGTEYQPAMYQIIATGKDKHTEFMITPQQKAQMFGDLFEPSKAVAASRPYTETLRKSGGYTTSIDGKETNENNAKFGSVDLPAVNTYGVSFNIVQPFLGSYSLRLNVYDPVAKKWHTNIPFPANGSVTDETLPIALGGLSDAAIFEILHNTPPTANDLKNVKNASKKPL